MREKIIETLNTGRWNLREYFEYYLKNGGVLDVHNFEICFREYLGSQRVIDDLKINVLRNEEGKVIKYVH